MQTHRSFDGLAPSNHKITLSGNLTEDDIYYSGRLRLSSTVRLLVEAEVLSASYVYNPKDAEVTLTHKLKVVNVDDPPVDEFGDELAAEAAETE